MSQENEIEAFRETFGDQTKSVFDRVLMTLQQAETQTAYGNASHRLLALLIETLSTEGHLDQQQLTEMLYRCGHDGGPPTRPRPKG